MIRISLNVLTAIQILLRKTIKYNISNEDNLWSINTSQIDTAWIIKISRKCKWVENSENKIFRLTEYGINLFSKNVLFDQNTFRVMLFDYIIAFWPTWSYKIPAGRKEAILLMTNDEKSCFQETGLLSDTPDKETVAWWDKLVAIIRKDFDEKKNYLGRTGERLTLIQEERRTGVKPQWMSIDSNLVGYDVLSQVSCEDKSSLLIESKASDMSIDDAYFYIASNEWHTACNSKHYMVYLWLLGASNKLAMLIPSFIAPYIPTNNLSGEWESVKIPFLSFAKHFHSTNIKDGDIL